MTSMVGCPKAAPQLGNAWGTISFLSLVLFLTMVGCTSDADKIRATNEAVGNPPATSTPLSAEIGSTEIQVGDCITSRLPEGIDLEIESVVIVPCSADWQYRALSSFTVVDPNYYPGKGHFSRRAISECDRQFTVALFPSAESWALGDRDVTCLQASFGLSKSDPAKLDRLVGSIRVKVGECFNEAPEIKDGVVELVSCSGEWQFRAINSFTVEDVGRYPGENLFTVRAYAECDRRYTNTLLPTADSWAAGVRTVTCIQEDFGLSGSNPAKLDRLANSTRLNVNECFNEVPETEHTMVELVSCRDRWQYRVLNSFTVDDLDRYPGEGQFDQWAHSECDPRSTNTLSPSADSWGIGDRSVTCLQTDFGMSTTDLAKLDRLVDLTGLGVGDCFNQAPETDYALVEIVSCSGVWESQVVGKFMVAVDDAFPGKEYIETAANEGCGDSSDLYYSPTAESWSLGDRTITCVKSAE